MILYEAKKNSGFVKPHSRLMVGLLNMLIDLICDYKGQSVGWWACEINSLHLDFLFLE
jgi:hypothetical protein